MELVEYTKKFHLFGRLQKTIAMAFSIGLHFPTIRGN